MLQYLLHSMTDFGHLNVYQGMQDYYPVTNRHICAIDNQFNKLRAKPSGI